MPIATTKMVNMQKYIMAWTRMAIPLVFMFPNSITLTLAGSWNSNPGDKRMNKTTATMTGPQSAPISLSLSWNEKEIYGGDYEISIGSMNERRQWCAPNMQKNQRELFSWWWRRQARMLNLVRRKTMGLRDRKGMLWLVGLLYGVGKETLFLSFASNNCSLQGFFSLALDIDEGGIFIKRNQKK